MSIKGMFNQKGQKKNEIEWEKQILRINALEVQIKGLLEFEKKFRTSMSMDRIAEKKEQSRVKNQGKEAQVKSLEDTQKFKEINKRLAELGQRVYQLENDKEEKGTLLINPLPQEEEHKDDERLIHLIQQLILEKDTFHLQREKELIEKIQALENQISIIKLKVEQSKIDYNQTPPENIATVQRTNEKRDENEVFYTQLERRVQILEHNLLLVNEVQVSLLKRMEELIETSNELLKQMDETEASIQQEDPICKTLYVDKLYLEKYEQNNNFAQLGIKNLNGALNIGATYGKETIPQKITEQIKGDMAKMKEMKEEMENSQSSMDKPDDMQVDESSTSEQAVNPTEENPQYTDIVIEDEET
ncbi:hypothetical protein R4Z10_06355 [Niallia sp. XMNu-256]|uniref:hypothetical protein n=1 Tax=Niallia sp. XMNu-256 TaxID=3082444 RepID=UPI0030CBA07F